MNTDNPEPDPANPAAAKPADIDVRDHFRRNGLDWGLVHVISPATLEMESVLSIIREVEPRAAVVVRFASSYRAATLQPDPSGEALPLLEDVWAPHLHALCINSLDAVRDREVYVAFEAAEEWPVRKANQDLLTSIEGLGVLAGGVRDGPATFLASRIDVWNDALRAGALGPVLREIAALPSHLATLATPAAEGGEAR